jgi:rhamnulokinase
MQNPPTVLAFDLGASSGRAIIGDITADPDGQTRLTVKEVHRFLNYPMQMGNHLHWDILYLLHEIKKGIKKAFEAGYAPQTFGIDTWGVDFGLLDKNGDLVGLPYAYRDPQTEGLIEEVNERIGQRALFQQSGLQFMMFNTIYQLYAMKKADSPKLDIAQTLLLTPDLLVYFLTGQISCEFTMATTTQLYHPVKQAWNKGLMERLGIPSHLFVEPVTPGTLGACLTPAISQELGVPAIQAVSVCTHDTESAVAAVPTEEQSFAYLVCGTWSLLGTEIDEPLLSDETMDLKFSNEGGAAGKNQLLKNIMGLWILQECKREWEEAGETDTYPELVHMAASSAPFRSLIFPDDDRFFSPHNMVEKIKQFCQETGQPIPETKAHIVRCILESLALRYRQALEQVEQLNRATYKGLHMVGGGIQNELLCQFTANAIGRPVWAGPIEASAIGNISLQFIALGYCTDLTDARKLVAHSFPVITYKPEAVQPWDQAYEKYTNL